MLRGRAAAKQQLLEALCYVTNRGADVEADQRGEIEEAQVGVEAFGGYELDWSLLQGSWRLLFTTAVDVLPILKLESLLLSPVTVGDIYQRFSSPEEGRVENVIKAGVAPFLQERDGATLTVSARYEVLGSHTIGLTFEEAGVGSLKITPLLETLLAPAFLPRGFLQLQLLMAVKQFGLALPLRSPAEQGGSGRGQGSYLLTYLDEDLLVGRAAGSAGTFIFARDAGE